MHASAAAGTDSSTGNEDAREHHHLNSPSSPLPPQSPFLRALVAHARTPTVQQLHALEHAERSSRTLRVGDALRAARFLRQRAEGDPAAVAARIQQHRATSQPLTPREALSLLHAAVLHMRIEDVAPLVAVGGAVDACGEHGDSALSLAAWAGRSDVCRVLLQGRTETAPSGLDAAGTRTSLSARHRDPNAGEAQPGGAGARGASACWSPLLWAAYHNDAATVHAICGGADGDGGEAPTIGAQVRARDHAGRSALTVAANEGHGTAVAALLEHGAGVDERNRRGQTPLMLACGHDVAAEAGLLRVATDDATNAVQISAHAGFQASAGCDEGYVRVGGVDVTEDEKDDQEDELTGNIEGVARSNTKERRTRRNDTRPRARQGSEGAPMKDPCVCVPHLAFASDPDAAVEALVAAGADVNAYDCNNRTPLMYAVEAGSHTRVQLLVRGGARVDAVDVRGFSALALAVERGDVALARLLLDFGAPARATAPGFVSPLRAAARNGNRVLAQLLLERGADADERDADGIPVAAVAVRHGHTGLLQLLLDAGADPNACFYWTEATGPHAPTRGGWEGGAPGAEAGEESTWATGLPASQGDTFLAENSSKDDEDLAQLSQAELERRMRKRNQRPLLSYAACLGQASAARLLLRARADVWQRDRRGRTALMHAVRHADVGVLEAVLGVVPATETRDAAEPAQWRDDREMLRYVNTRDNKGDTSLHYAAYSGHEGVAALLLHLHADASMQNNAGKTPLMIAVDEGASELAEELLHHAQRHLGH